jgi:hypothetical protein
MSVQVALLAGFGCNDTLAEACESACIEDWILDAMSAL